MRAVVIDDTDPNIKYEGEGWFQDNVSQDDLGNFGPTYEHTLHGTKANSSLTYTFQGTSIEIWGTTDLAKISAGVFDPSWECFVDKISVGATKSFEYAENNWNLCGQNNLPDGIHEIVINVNSAGQVFWVDRIVYAPSPSLSLNAAVILVENHDTGINLDSKWQALGDEAAMTQTMSSIATFIFTGTSVSWVGYIPTELPHNASFATYSVDGGPPIVFTLRGLPPGFPNSIYNQVFFTARNLSAGSHSLVVTHQGTSAQTPLTLNFLYVNTTLTPTTSTVSSPSGLSSGSNISPTSHELPPSNRPPDLTTGTTVLTRVLVGSVIGGVLFVVLTVLLFWKYKRSRYGGVSIIRILSREMAPVPTGPLIPRPWYNAAGTHPSILLNPVLRDGSGNQMQTGSVAKPLVHPQLTPPAPSSTPQRITKSSMRLLIPESATSRTLPGQASGSRDPVIPTQHEESGPIVTLPPAYTEF
ncbi:hypothetical protein BDZ94DRAFT_1300969 [Collybia nuda]|uniref:Uncharacterized protein n=1 Tax=Collybia nuda TaxID=64659 RepID=A0A9P5Y012_9AGAR|nr:hypothetical protein BDZ94DRAFT_1300969 [Collybia nuda]